MKRPQKKLDGSTKGVTEKHTKKFKVVQLYD